MIKPLFQAWSRPGAQYIKQLANQDTMRYYAVF